MSLLYFHVAFQGPECLEQSGGDRAWRDSQGGAGLGCVEVEVIAQDHNFSLPGGQLGDCCSRSRSAVVCCGTAALSPTRAGASLRRFRHHEMFAFRAVRTTQAAGDWQSRVRRHVAKARAKASASASSASVTDIPLASKALKHRSLLAT
jgi:hypothetical protein